MSEENINENTGSEIPDQPGASNDVPAPSTPITQAGPDRSETHHFRNVILLWAALSIIGMLLVGFFGSSFFPPTASDVGNAANFTFVLLSVLSIPVALFVFVFLGYSMFAFRVKERPTEDGFPIHPTPALQIGWLGITSALCLFLVIYGLFAFYQESVAAPSNTLVVQVTGQQWMWTFNYPQYGVSSQGQVLELPVNRPVVFHVTSKDVLHGFAVRDLGVRVDANPGEMTVTSVVTPNAIGSYTVVCVELCGLYHSYMWSAVKVESDSSFNSWILSQGGHL
jgi:cytochrome c oxidase subunit 2